MQLFLKGIFKTMLFKPQMVLMHIHTVLTKAF